MSEQEKLFLRWKNLEYEIQNIASVVQNPGSISESQIDHWIWLVGKFRDTLTRLELDTSDYLGRKGKP